MKMSIRFVRKVYFPTTFRLTGRRLPRLSPPLRSRATTPAPAATAPPSPTPPASPQQPLSPDDARSLDSLRPWARALVRRFGLPDADVEELLQDTFLAATSRWSLFQAPPDVPATVARRSWIAAILWKQASRLLARLERERARAPLHDEEGGHAGATDSHESLILTRDQLLSLRQATTPERWRVCVAHWLEDVSVEELARRESRPAGTLYNLLRLARLDFAAALRRESAAARGPLVARRKR